MVEACVCCWGSQEKTPKRNQNGCGYRRKTDDLIMHKYCVYRARKLLNLRVFEEPTSGKGWEKSVSDLGLEILCVSQVS